MGATVVENETEYWAQRGESALNRAIKNEKNPFRHKALQQIYMQLKRTNGFKKKEEK